MVEARVDGVKTKTTEDFDFETDFWSWAPNQQPTAYGSSGCRSTEVARGPGARKSTQKPETQSHARDLEQEVVTKLKGRSGTETKGGW